MYIDPREQRRRAWRIIGRSVWKELIGPILLIAGIGVAVGLGVWLWSVHPLLLIIPAAMLLLGTIGPLVWDWARDRAHIELTYEKLEEARQENSQ